MDYGYLIRRSWEIVWNNKWLILLGVLIALGSGGGGSSNSSYRGGGQPGSGDFGDFTPPENFNPETIAELIGVSVAILVAVVCIVVIIGLVLVILARIASGAVIAGVDQIESTGASTLSRSWSAAMERIWTLIGIGVVNGIPSTIVAILALISAILFIFPILAAAGELDEAGTALAGGASLIFVVVIALCCLFGIVSLILSLLRGLADRAAMLEGTGIFDSYRRGWEVLKSNVGEAVVVAAIHFGIGIVVGFVMLFIFGGLAVALIPIVIGASQGDMEAILIPVLVVCACALIPIVLAIQGFISAYTFTFWTLAYRHWIGRGTTSLTGPAADVPPPAPAV